MTRKQPHPTRALDTQVGGDHYKHFPIQPIEFILANELPYVEGSVVARMLRWRAKGGLEDLRKAQHEIQLLIEFEEARGTK